MAATTQVAPARTASALALWHLLSLDAPTVAALWTWFIARASQIHLPWVAPAAMALAVWILYAADRLLDARLLDARRPEARDLEARHFFHHLHRRPFLAGVAVAAVALAAMLPRLDPAATPLYLVEGALLAAWFLILHASPSAHRLPKETAVGVFFSAAVFIPTVSREPALRLQMVPSAVLFAALCSLNCLFIYAWEHDGTRHLFAATAHTTTRLALARLPALAIATATAGGALIFFGAVASRPIFAACALSALLLLGLHCNRRSLTRIHLRAAADLALLTPLFLLPFLR